MQTSGILIRMSANSCQDSVATALAKRPDLTLGERTANIWPAVLEAEDGRSSVDAFRAIERMPEVVRVDVVYVATEPNESASAATRTVAPGGAPTGEAKSADRRGERYAD